MGRLLLCAALLSLVIGATADPQYVLSTPVQLIGGDTARACIHIVGNTEPLDVSVELEHDGRSTSIIGENVSDPKYFQCGDYKVPSVPKAVPAVITFSATGQKTELKDRKTVVINSASTNCIYQMDKPRYKPGQTVYWRLLCLDSQLKPVNEKITAVYLQDPSGTRISQWLLPELNHGVASFEFPLTSGAPLGTYRITAEKGSGYPINSWFPVEETVLPRFTLKVDSPQTISVTAESIKFTVSAEYVFGEPMPGSVTVRYCRRPQFYGRRQNCFKDKGDSCADMVGELDANGTYSGEIDLHSTFSGSSSGMSLTLDVAVTEAETGILATDTRYIWATSQPTNINFEYESMQRYYRRGINYIVGGTLTDETGQPLPDKEVEVQIDNGDTRKAVTEADGRFDHEIDTSNMVADNFTVRISFTDPNQCYFSEWSQRDYPSAEYTVYRFYSYSGSFLQVKQPKGEMSCGQSYSIGGSYIISPEATGPGVDSATFNYLVLSRSKIVQSGQMDVDLSSSRNGSFSLDLAVCADLAPHADLVVYSLLKNEMIADTVSLNIEKCFKNKVSMTFSQEKVAPGSKVDVQLSADPDSYCALRVMDASLLILNPYEQFSADSIYSSGLYYSYGYNVAGFDTEDPAPPCEDPDTLIFYNGRYYVPVSSKTEGDTYQKLKDIGLVFASSERVRKPEVCDKNPPPVIIHPGRAGGDANFKFAAPAAESAAAPQAQESVRTNFSETFLWVMVPLDAQGQATLSETIPDTITKWQGTAFCTSEETGFGMTKNPANLTASLPFFLELSLPYSIYRDEKLSMTGVVRNYLEQSVKVQATLENSNAFTAVLKDGQQDVCVAPNGRTSYNWEVQPNEIGEMSITASAQTSHIGDCNGPNDVSQPPRKDTVVNTVIVQPEGIYVEQTLSNLVFVQNTNSQVPVSINLPADTVPGSPTAYATAIGDIFGLPLQNLDNLLTEPHGSGEQNLGQLAVIPEAVDYLNSTGQLKDETYKKAQGLMSSGYYRQLGFTSGSGYLTFLNAIEGVNSVLTASTFRIFEKLKKYIYIDEDRQQQTLIWLENSQRLESGCFKAEGTLFTIPDTDTDRDVYYTAVLAIALLESEYSLGKTLLNGALECLKNASNSEQAISTQAIMLYVFTLANLPEYREPLLQSVMGKAKTEGGTIHFERDDMPNRKVVPFFYPPYASAEIEATSYVLLSHAAGPINQDTLTKIGQMAIWLVRQQNSRGGLRCSKDTALALQALAAVGKLLYTANSQQTVVVKRGNGEVTTVHLNQDNRLVANRVPLPEPNGDYSIEVSGSGWCMIQTTVGYNVPVPKENAAFSLSLSTSSEGCVNGVARSIMINGTVSYHGRYNDSGLTMLRIRMLSGYDPDYSSLYKLKNDNIITKFEVTPKEVIMYIENVPADNVNISFRALIGQRVLNVKRSTAVVYRYYGADENGAASYSHPCAAAAVGSS